MSPEAPSPPQQQVSNGGGKGVTIALIGAAATVVVGLFTYLGHREDPAQKFTFSGVVTNDDGKGVPNARVIVTEDQNTSQTNPTDQYGNFHVQLSQKAQSLSIRVDAGDGYDVVTVDANPHRTGPEVVTIHKKLVQLPKAQSASRTELVRTISEFEQRLSDVEQYSSQLAPLSNGPLDSRQALSIYIWRVWYGATDYQNAEPEFKGVRWKAVLAKIRELGITEKYQEADRAIGEIESGDIEGKHFTTEYLEPRLHALREYRDTVLEPAIK